MRGLDSGYGKKIDEVLNRMKEGTAQKIILFLTLLNTTILIYWEVYSWLEV